MSYLAVVTTVGSQAQAQSLAKTLVERRLVACAQISAIESYYHWEGAVQHEPEWRLVLKTRTELQPDLLSALRQLHPYELPALHALPLPWVDAAYGDWITAQVQPGDHAA